MKSVRLDRNKTMECQSSYANESPTLNESSCLSELRSTNAIILCKCTSKSELIIRPYRNNNSKWAIILFECTMSRQWHTNAINRTQRTTVCECKGDVTMTAVSIEQLRCPSCGELYSLPLKPLADHPEYEYDATQSLAPIRELPLHAWLWYIACSNGHKWTIKQIIRELNKPDKILLGDYIGDE